MGLDCYWHKCDPAKFLDEDAADCSCKTEQPPFDPPLKLCGGLLSGDGQGSFRGKVYAARILDVARVDLYREVVPNADVRRVARDLLGALHDGRLADFPGGEAADLVRMFETYGAAGWWIYSWW